MRDLDVVGLLRARRLELAQHPREFLGVNPAEPFVWSVCDFVLVTPDERDPSRREVDPVRRQVPFPQCLAVQASAGSTLFHSLGEGSPYQ